MGEAARPVADMVCEASLFPEQVTLEGCWLRDHLAAATLSPSVGRECGVELLGNVAGQEFG